MSQDTGGSCLVSGIYVSACHNSERTILEGQRFPPCGQCDQATNWVLVRFKKRIKKVSAAKTSS